jgi:serine/threonine protein kinase
MVEEYSDDDDYQQEMDEESLKREEEFFKGLEFKLKEMDVAIISDDQVKLIRPSIGKGAFGKVYKGIYKDKEVAIKKMIMKEENYIDEECTMKAIYDITNEIKTVKYVTNSKIPIFYGLWKYLGKFHLIFEFCPGKNLKEAYANLNENQKFSVCLQMCETLESIHDKKLMHRDIKPSNIMIDANLDIKLIDFGVSRIASKTITFTKDVAGTTRYMAPEMFDVNEETESDRPITITTKIDVWSMGCTISEIFSGVIPWWNTVKNEIVVSRKLMEKAPFPIPKEITNPDAREIIEQCTKISVDERISTPNLVMLIREKLKKYE